MKKFEFTGETKTLLDGTVLHRIEALVRIEFGCMAVEIGELGGWIEKENNLSHDGNAWVFRNAKVYGNARVCGDARVCGNAEVFRMEHYLVMGPIGSRNAFTTFFRTKERNIKVVCGCFFGTIDEFLAKVKQTHGDSKHAKVYRAAVEVALAQLEDVERRNINA